MDPLPFSAATNAWFAQTLGKPTEVQRVGWRSIAEGAHSLLLAPTGSGKTLAAFLYGIDRLFELDPDAGLGVRLLYVSPLKALVYDVERNLRNPLSGILKRRAAAGLPMRDLRIDVRTGDTTQRERRQQRTRPADILVTTPESLFLLLTSQARETLRTVDTVIIDEIHVMAASKRGTHLALSLERLSSITTRDPQRIGLSATVRPAEEVASFLGGDREVTVVDAVERPRLDLKVVVAAPDITNVDATVPSRALAPKSSPGRHEGADVVPDQEKGIWAAIYPRLIELIETNTSTLIFVNSRGECERLTRRLNDLADRELVHAHHGSISHERRRWTEEKLKAGELPAIVATSSLELGIDMGAVDLVISIASPGSVSRGLQRVGRAGHQVHAVSVGRIFPKFQGDLLESATVARGMVKGSLEPLRVPRNVLDVLSQQLVAMCAEGEISVDRLYESTIRAYPYRDLSRAAFDAVLDMLAGRYPSNELVELRPRVVWDRDREVVSLRRGARMAAILNAGTIPDRGLFRVQLGAGGPKVGELDEEMVYESQAGDTIALGASTWRIEEITHDRVIVAPAPGEFGRLPFWRGDSPGRPVELGEDQGELLRELESRNPADAIQWLQDSVPMDTWAAENLVRFVSEQREHSLVPTDRTLVAERFRDEVGDWRLCLLSPFGSRVHGPLAIAIQAKMASRTGVELDVTYNDDGLIWRGGSHEELPDIQELIPAADEVERLVADHVGSSALFAAMFRENAGRSLLLTRRRPDGRNPLWSQRLKAKNLLGVVRRYPRFPIVLETYRQCLQDIFDLPGLVELLTRIERGHVRIESRETRSPSPFASSVVFEHIANHLYETDSPSAELRARALTIDRPLLRQLLGHVSERELVDSEVVDEVEARLQCVHPDHQARDANELHDLLREVGALRSDAIRERCGHDPNPWLEELCGQKRVVKVEPDEWAAVEIAQLYQVGLGRGVGQGALALTEEELGHPVEHLIRRIAARKGPFSAAQLAGDLQIASALLEPVLERLEGEGALVAGELRPGGDSREWCDVEVWRRIKRLSLARLRDEIQPVDASWFARFLCVHQGVDQPGRGALALERTLEQLEGLVLPWSVWIQSVLPARVSDFQVEMLDLLCSGGEWLWQGYGRLGARDGRVAFFRRAQAGLFSGAAPREAPPDGSIAAEVLNSITEGGALFASEISASGSHASVQQALLELAWAGWVRNDRIGPLVRAGRRRGSRRLAGTTVDGRWSLTRLVELGSATKASLVWVRLLLNRYGFVSRDVVANELLEGGFSAVYDVCTEMEAHGQARRGLFVHGLSGIQFASLDAIETLRESPGGEAVWAVSSLDPAQPYGSIVPWPKSKGAAAPRRTAGSVVVIVGGKATIYVSANRRDVIVFEAENPEVVAAIQWLATSRLGRAQRALAIDKVNGAPAHESSWTSAFRAAGFVQDHRGFVSAR